MNLKQLQKNLSFLRNKYDYSYDALSEESTMSKSYLFYLENQNDINPTLKSILKLIDVFEIDINSFIFEDLTDDPS